MNHSTPGLPPSPTPGVHPDSYPSSQWCHPAISSSVVPFSSCLCYLTVLASSRKQRLPYPQTPSSTYLYILSTLCCTLQAISNICWINKWPWTQIGGKATEMKVVGTEDKFCLGWFLSFLSYIPSQNVLIYEKRNLKYLLNIGILGTRHRPANAIHDGISILPSTKLKKKIFLVITAQLSFNLQC